MIGTWKNLTKMKKMPSQLKMSEAAHAQKRNPLSDRKTILHGGRYTRVIAHFTTIESFTETHEAGKPIS